MMTKNLSHEREQLEMLLVPEDHIVRQLESAIDFSFIYPWLKTYIQGSIVQVSIQ